MILATSKHEAEATRRSSTTGDGLTSQLILYFGPLASARPANPPSIGSLCPVAFRVDQEPNSRAQPHFHQANQFQVFVDGDGILGKRPIRGLTVQYADAYTPYGPICAGAAGISYLTLRNGWDPGAFYMPGARDTLKAFARKPRAIIGSQIDDVVIPLGDDGLGAWRYQVAAGHSFAGPQPGVGGGQYWFVLHGEDVAAPLGEGSCLFLSADEAARQVTAGPAGLDVLVLQFPRFAQTSASN